MAQKNRTGDVDEFQDSLTYFVYHCASDARVGAAAVCIHTRPARVTLQNKPDASPRRLMKSAAGREAPGWLDQIATPAGKVQAAPCLHAADISPFAQLPQHP